LLGEVIMVGRAAFVAVLLLFGAGLVGRTAMPRSWRSFHPGVALLQAVSWGLTVVGLAVWVVGSVLGTTPALVVAALIGLGSLPWIRQWAGDLVRATVLAWRTLRSHPGASVVLALPALWSLQALILPVIDSDGLRYHLALPKLFLLEGRVFLYPWDVGGAYPQCAEMFNMLALALGSPEAAKWMHFLVSCLAVSAAVILIGGRRSDGVLGGALLAATPVVLAGASAAFVDGFSLLHVAVAVLGLRRRLRPGAVGLALAGAAWTKWTAAPAIAGCLLVLVVRTGSGRRLRALIAAGVPIVLVIAPLALRNTAATGDPFFPILTGIVHGEVPGVDPELMDTVSQRHREIPGPLGIPWGLSSGEVEPDEIVGWHHLAGLVLLPLLWRDRRVRLAAAVIVPYLLIGLAYHPSMRLALPLIWGLAVVEGVALARVGPRLAVALVAAVTVPLLFNVGRDVRSVIGEYLTGRFDARAVVRRLVPGADAAFFVDAQPGGGRVMALDFPAPFLFDRPWVAEGLVNRPPLGRWLAESGNASELLKILAAHDIGWIIVTPGYGGGRPGSLLPVASTPNEAAILFELRRRMERRTSGVYWNGERRIR